MTTAVMSISSTKFYPKVEIINQEANPSFEKHKYDTQHLEDQHTHQSHTSSRESTRVHRRRSKYDRAIVGRYKLIQTIGTGNFAKVKLASHLITGREVAIKIIDKTELSSSSKRKLSREVRLMKVLNHPNIVRLLEIIDTDKMMYLVMEYASGGELYEYLVKHGRMTEKLAREKFRQILSAVQYCHQKRIIHRDLKTENLLLDANFNIKLADFGFANEFQEGTKLNTFCGSPPYAAPELFRGKEYDGPEVDVWSLGVILFKLVSGALPFDGHSLSELRDSVLRGRYRIPFYMSTECERLLKKMLVLNPAKRHSLESIMKDRWVNIGYEDNPLSPYVEPKPDFTDPARIEVMMNMGFSLDAIIKSLRHGNFDEITATYHLLEKEEKPVENNETEVSTNSINKTETPDQLSSSCPSKDKELNANTTDLEKETVKPTDVFNSIPVKITREDQCNDVHNNHNSNLVINGKQNAAEPPRDRKECDGSKNTVTEPREKVIMIYGNVDRNHQISQHTKDTTENRETNNGRPNTTYNVKTPEESDKSYTKDRSRPSPTHWYPTGGVAVRNGVTVSRDSAAVARMQILDEESTWYKPVEVASSQTEKTVDSQARISVDRMQPEISLSLQKSPAVQTEIIPSTPLDTVKQTPKLNTVEPLPFNRFDSVRQTVHSTNRPQLEQQFHANSQVPGKAEDKTARVAAARTNLAELGSVGEEKLVIQNPELNKPRGFFRTFTSRFSKRSRPLVERSATVTSREQTDRVPVVEIESKQRGLTLGHQIGGLGAARSHSFRGVGQHATRPISQISTGAARPSIDLNNNNTCATTTPPIIRTDSSFESQNSQDANENSPFGFLRHLATRMSKKKSGDYSPIPDGTLTNSQLENKNSSMKRQTSFSFLPPTILTSVQKEPNLPDERNSSRATENARSTIGCSDPVRNSPKDGIPMSVVQNSPGSPKKKPRVLRFTWSLKITSKLPPDEIVWEIKRVLDKMKYNYDHRQKFLFTCDCGTHTSDMHVQWEMEVCQLLRQGVYGVRFHKISGTEVAYKHVMAVITQEIKL